jgi:hypothetical protein
LPSATRAMEGRGRRTDSGGSGSDSGAPPAGQYASIGEYVKKCGGDRPIRKVLIANNGIAAVKAIRSIRRWAYETCGDLHAVSRRRWRETARAACKIGEPELIRPLHCCCAAAGSGGSQAAGWLCQVDAELAAHARK